jgi:RNA polymerase sporulation-specific sigma factor
LKTTKYYINGAEQEDLFQEGMIGLYKAIRDFDKTKEISFKNFAYLCIERQIMTAIKGSNRQKHVPLNSAVSLNQSSFENNDGDEVSDLIDTLDTHVIEDPLETLTKQEYFSYVNDTIDKSLSEYEKNVLNKYIAGESYKEIAESLDTPIKSVDNAIQRIRKKTIKNIGKEEN